MVPRFDGSKATKELGLKYTSLEVGVPQCCSHVVHEQYVVAAWQQGARRAGRCHGRRVDAWRRALCTTCVRHMYCTGLKRCAWGSSTFLRLAVGHMRMPYTAPSTVHGWNGAPCHHLQCC